MNTKYVPNEHSSREKKLGYLVEECEENYAGALGWLQGAVKQFIALAEADAQARGEMYGL